MKENYETRSQSITGLRGKGYNIDFNIGNECLVCKEIPGALSPDDFVIDKEYRFEGTSTTEDLTTLYAISSIKYKAKGLLVNGYGSSAVTETNSMIQTMQTNG